MFSFVIRKCNPEELKKINGITNNKNSEFKRRADYFIAESNGKLVGKLGYVKNFLSGTGPHLFIGMFRSEIEKRGIGTGLILAVENEARRLKIPLIIHRFSDNGGFYEKMGYHVNYEYHEAHKWLC